MSAPLRGAKKAPRTSAGAPPAEGGTLFSYELRREGRPIASLRGVADGAGVTVEASVHPVGSAPSEPPIVRPFAFPTAEAAHRFVDESLTALEYLDCELVET